MRLATMIKAPQETLDYDVLFYKWLKEDDRLDNVLPSLSTGATLIIDHIDLADKTLKFWLKGGENGEEATVFFDVTTLKGRKKQGCFKVKIRECCQ